MCTGLRESVTDSVLLPVVAANKSSIFYNKQYFLRVRSNLAERGFTLRRENDLSN